MEINDRGNKKWSSMMLSKHTKALSQLWDDALHDVKKPMLEEDKINELNDIIQRSLEHYEPVTLSWCKDGHIHTARGVVVKYDSYSYSLKLRDNEDRIHTIKASDIVDATTYLKTFYRLN
jgi:hypothetical protein